MIPITFLLGTSTHAMATEVSCEALFGRAKASAVDIHSPRFTELTQASQEYIVRLMYLLVERPMLTPQSLKTLIASPQPVNPFSAKPIDTRQYPHYSAFADLLTQPLDWEAIRQAARDILKVLEVKREREQSASEETKEVLTPTDVMKFPFQGQKLVVTSRGQVLAIDAEVTGPRRAQTTTVKAFDLASGNEVASVSYEGEGKPERLDAIAWGDSVFVSLPNNHANVIATVDLLNKKVMPLNKIPMMNADTPEHADSWAIIAFPSLMNFGGKLAVVAAQEDNIRVFDVTSGQPLMPQIISDQLGTEFLTSGTLGNTFYFSKRQVGSILLEPPDLTKPKHNHKLTLLNAFEYHGQSYALGINIDETKPDDYSQSTLRFVSLDGKVKSPTFIVKRNHGWPHLVDQFEQDGILYGVISTSDDLYVVDLFNGKITQRLSDTVDGERLNADWENDTAGQVGFTYKGRRYIIGKIVENKAQPTLTKLLGLVLLDAVTLEPAIGTNYPVMGEITGIRRLPGPGNELKFLLNFKDGTSRIVSMVKRS